MIWNLTKNMHKQLLLCCDSLLLKLRKNCNGRNAQHLKWQLSFLIILAKRWKVKKKMWKSFMTTPKVDTFSFLYSKRVVCGVVSICSWKIVCVTSKHAKKIQKNKIPRIKNFEDMHAWFFLLIFCISCWHPHHHLHQHLYHHICMIIKNRKKYIA